MVSHTVIEHGTIAYIGLQVVIAPDSVGLMPGGGQVFGDGGSIQADGQHLFPAHWQLPTQVRRSRRGCEMPRLSWQREDCW